MQLWKGVVEVRLIVHLCVLLFLLAEVLVCPVERLVEFH